MRKTTKIVVSVLLALCMIMPMSTMVFANSGDGGATSVSDYTGNTSTLQEDYETTIAAAITAGTLGDLNFEIDSADKLHALVKAINTKCTTSANYFTGTIKLTKDLVFNKGAVGDWAFSASAYNWPMITYFAGTFDGDGHTISGLFMNNTTAYTGFIGRLSNTVTITDLGIINSYFNSTYATNNSGATGGIAARAMGKAVVTIENCYVDAIIDSKVAAGGILGVCGGNGAYDNMTNATTVSNCAFSGSITVGSTKTGGNFGGAAGASAAGIVGQTLGYNLDKTETTGYNNLQITDCVNFGAIKNTNTTIGTYTSNSVPYYYSQAAAGILGYAEDGRIDITRCLNFGTTNAAKRGNENALVGMIPDVAMTNAYATNRGVKLVMTDCYIFSNLNQNLFNATEELSNVTITSNTATVADVKTIEGDSESAKSVLGASYFGVEDAKWVARTGDYPLPTPVNDNFVGILNDTKNLVEFVYDKSVAKTKYLSEYDSEAEVSEFSIDSVAAFVAIADLLNESKLGDNGAKCSIKLTNDIVFNESIETKTPYVWRSIANFKGEFDGQGHTISGIYVYSNENFAGIFSILLAGAEVRNFAVVDSYFAGANGSYTPSIIGRINAADVTVENIYSAITATGKNGVGGIVCLVTGNGTTTATKDGDTVTSRGNATTLDVTAIIQNCVFAGKLTASTGTAGGIVGKGGTYLNSNLQAHVVRIENCANYGEITAPKAGAMTGDVSKVKLVNCANFGNVDSTDDGFVDNALVAVIEGTKPTGCLSIEGVATAPTLEADISGAYTLTAAETASVFGNAANNETFNTITIAKVTDGIKTELPTGFTNWTKMTNYAGEDQYPLPTVIYENFFKIKLKYYQTTDLDTNDNTYDLRIIAEIDSLDYAKAGFKVTRTGFEKNTLDVDTTEGVKVYKTVTGGGEDVTAIGDKCFVTITIEGISGAQTITVTPYTYGTANGELVEGAPMELSFDINGNLINN